MFPIRKPPLLIAISLLVSVGSIRPRLVEAQQQSRDDDFKSAPVQGKATFNSTCAGCHGLDGRGSEKGPNIASNAKAQRLSDAQIANIVSNGRPGTGMPAFPTLAGAPRRAVVRYLRTLQGKGETVRTRGDSVRGRNIFFGKGECSNCHTISGEGGFLGPDLTAYGAQLPAKAIREGILNSNRIVPAGYKLAAATTRDGMRLEGVVRSEDNFSVQFETGDGSFHFVEKSDLEKLEYLDRSLMPADYATRLTSAEIDDLVAYLANPVLSQKKAQSSDKAGEPSQ